MKLIKCPACFWEISIEAEACPQCGHPNKEKRRAVVHAPQCYSCVQSATTKCQSCNRLSCVQHLDSIYVSHGKGGSYELRCTDCYESAHNWKIISWVIAAIFLFIFFIVMSRGF